MAAVGHSDSGNASLLELRINPHDVREGLVRDDRTGGWRTDVYTWHGIVELRWEGKTLFAIVTSSATDNERSEAVRKKWAVLLISGAADLVRSDMLSAFEMNDVGNDLLAKAHPDALAISLAPPESFRTRFSEEHETDQLARRSFDFATRRLLQYADHPPPHGISSDAPSMYAYLENCLSAGDLGTMHAWYQEKMTGIARQMAELAKRKRRNHPGFREAQDYMRRNLFNFSAPRAWRRRPPTIDPKKLATDPGE